MKIRLITIILMMLCLAVSAQLIVLCGVSDGAQFVGGDFGRAWLSNNAAQSPSPAGSSNNTTANITANNTTNNTTNNNTADWGGSPKGTTDLKSNLVKPPNTQKTSTDWLGSSTITDSQTNPTDASKGGAQQTYYASGTMSPVHKMDASFNLTSEMPEPDSSGLINGVPAESYYAFGPALFTI